MSNEKQVAENATFQAFLNSYSREVYAGELYTLSQWREICPYDKYMKGAHVLVLSLRSMSTRLVIDVCHYSLVGRHSFGQVLREASEGAWILVEKLAAVILLLQEMQHRPLTLGQAPCFDECLTRLMESYQAIAYYVLQRSGEGEGLYDWQQSFIESEQALLFGHWLHPTPKSRQGMAMWQQTYYAPELKGAFQLHYFQVDACMIRQDTALDVPATTLVWQELADFVPNMTYDPQRPVVPMHPLQAQWLLQQSYVQEAIHKGMLTYMGPLGKPFTATSSIRTVYSRRSAWMFKFSIPVKVTNSVRVSRMNELRAGVAVARLLQKTGSFNQRTSFHIIHDPAYMTLAWPGMRESGFEVILRKNVFSPPHDKGISLVATLVQEPLPPYHSKLASLIKALAQKEGRSTEEVALDWYRLYIKQAIFPLIQLYDELGLALEAHQQNSLLDIRTGYPNASYYRDNQGYYLASSYRGELLQKEPSLADLPELFFEESLIADRFGYYLFQNQAFSIIQRLATDGFADEPFLLGELKCQLQQLQRTLSGAGKRFLTHLFEKDNLAFKANLLTCFHDIDELTTPLEQAVYTTTPNPWKEKNVAEWRGGIQVGATATRDA
ncbi:IucA/IucC family protein [Bacillus sp. FSL W7-1360]